MEFGDELRKWREEDMMLLQKEAAQALDVSISAYCSWEQKRHIPHLNTRRRILAIIRNKAEKEKEGTAPAHRCKESPGRLSKNRQENENTQTTEDQT